MKILRGMTTPIIWIDEMAFISHVKEMYTSMAPAFTRASENAAKHNKPYGILITTTPSSLDHPSGKFFHNDIMQKAAPFTYEFYDYYFEKGEDWLKDYIYANSANSFVYIEYSYKELGRSEEWLETQIRALNNDMVAVKREIFLEWTYSSDNSVFSEELLHEIDKEYVQDYELSLLLDDKYTINLTRHPSNMHEKNYIIAADIAGGLSQDRTALVIIDPLTYEIIGVFKNELVSAVDLVDIVADLIKTYFKSAVLVVELNYTGRVFVEAFMKEHPTLSGNVFYTLRNRKGYQKSVSLNERLDPTKSKGNKVEKEVREYGITTNTKTRPIMIDEILFSFINERPYVFNNVDIFDELKYLERKKNGKIEHADGAHDDVLMAYLVGLYALIYESRTMSRFLKEVHDKDHYTDLTPEEQAEQAERRTRVNRLGDVVRGTTPTLIENSASGKKTLREEAISKKQRDKNSTVRNIDKMRRLINN